jgi:hypothetical protein
MPSNVRAAKLPRFAQNMVLLHATGEEQLTSIAAQGIRPGSYWAGWQDIHQYYLATVADENQTPATLSVKLADLDPHFLAPDLPGIQEPITMTLGMTESEVWRRWSRSKQTWSNSLRIVGTLRYNALIPPELIRYAGEPLTVWAANCLAAGNSAELIGTEKGGNNQ